MAREFASFYGSKKVSKTLRQKKTRYFWKCYYIPEFLKSKNRKMLF